MKTKKSSTYISPALLGLAVPIGSLHADADNARRHPKRNLDAIAASLKKFGQQAPAVYVLRGRRKVVIKGNGLLAAARKLKWKHLAAVESGLAGHDATAYAIADNRTTDLSDFDEALLATQLAELNDADFDLKAAGFTDAELAELLKDAEPERPDKKTEAKKAAARSRRISELYSVIVECKNEREQLAFYRRMQKEGRKCKLYVL